MISGGIFGEFSSPAVEIFRAGPDPAVRDGLGLTDGRYSGINVAVRVRVVNNSSFGFGDGSVSSAKVLLFEIKSAGTEDDDRSAVHFSDVNNDVSEDEIAKSNERGTKFFFIARFISLDDSGAELDHTQMIKTEERGSKEGEWDENQNELPNSHGFEGAEQASQSVRFSTTHYYL